MAKFIFYTIEGATLAVDGSLLDTCQVLGTAKGKDKQDALNNLPKENLWILERNFDPNLIVVRKLASTEEEDPIPPLPNYNHDPFSLNNGMREKLVEIKRKWLESSNYSK